jgi:hypothetical protein
VVELVLVLAPHATMVSAIATTLTVVATSFHARPWRVDCASAFRASCPLSVADINRPSAAARFLATAERGNQIAV